MVVGGTVIQFSTETGSTYLWDDVHSKLKRTGKGARSVPLQKDGEWESVLGTVYLCLGESAVFALDRATQQFCVTTAVTDIRGVL